MIHFHKYKLVAKTYAPPRVRGFGEGSMSEYHMERLVYGVTTLVYGCEKCGKPLKVEALGNEVRV